MSSAMSHTFSVIQGAQSTTFSTPPLDGSLTFAEILAFHAEHSGSHKLFVYAEDGEVKSIDYATAFRAQRVAASIVKTAFEAGRHLYVDQFARPVFGILATADTVTYATLVFGIEQTGAVPFPMSTRNSAVATAHLIRTTGVRQVFVSDDAPMHMLASETLDLLAKDGYGIEFLDLPRFQVLYGLSVPSPALSESRIAPLSLDALTLIMHSSGTSAFPKPVQMNGRNYLNWGVAYYYGELDVCGYRFGIHTAPMFHSMGMLILAFAVCSGVELAVYKPARPPVVANPTSFLHDLVATKSDWAMTVPAHIEEWSQDPASVQLLKSHIKRILFGGGPLNKHVGDALHAHGVCLENGYGITEVGPMHRLGLSDKSRPVDWEYFRLPNPDFVTIEMMPHGEHDGLLEPVVLAGDRFSPNVVNTVVYSKPGYATGDLVQEHPLHKGLYKIYGRADEQIMLSTGEKTNPVPLERILVQDSRIAIAVFFGRGRFNNGVLLQPTKPFNSNDTEKVKRFRDAIWPVVSRMNDYAPAHSRVLKQMILVASPEKPLELTAKGSARRSVCLAMYEDEIEAIYKEAELFSDGPRRPATWTQESSLEFVTAVVETALHQKVAKNDELFSLGCDSLAAAFIRNNIVRALRTSTFASDLDVTRKVPRTLVYQHPFIHALSDFVFALVTGRDLEPDADAILEQKVHAMRAMVVKYSINVPSPRVAAGGRLPEQETVLLTGTTGRLGCHLLAQLIQDPKVRHIYALNRVSRDEASSEALSQRMSSAFASWKLDPALLHSGKVTLLASNYAAEYLGLDVDTYAEIEGQLTTIIHNAWRVDFNVALSGFESLIAGVRRLMDLAANSSISGGARLLFVSSVSVLFNAPSDRPTLEEPIEDPRMSAGIGYGESKWVAETLLLRARQAVGLRAAAARVGQIAGDTRVGGWSKQEWVGAIARLGQIVQALPQRDELVTWVPVDIAATALIDMARSEEAVFNLVAPVASDWQTVFSAFAKQLDLPLVKYDEWAARVMAAAEANMSDKDMQPFALAHFFQAGNFGESAPVFTAHACAVSPALANMAPIGKSDVALYVDFWRKIGFLHA